MQGCLGALDGTYINVLVPKSDQPRFRNRKGLITTNTLAACDQHMRFSYVLPGWEGSAGDARVLRDAVNRPYGLKVPLGIKLASYLLFSFAEYLPILYYSLLCLDDFARKL